MCVPWLWQSTAFKVGHGLWIGVTTGLEVFPIFSVSVSVIAFDSCFQSRSLLFLSTKPWQFHLQKDCPARHIWPDYRFCLGHADIDELCPPRVIFAASSISLPRMSLVMFCASKWPTSMNFFFSLTWLCTSHSSGNKFTSCHTCSPVANAIHHPRIWFHLLAPTVGQMRPWLQSQALITILTQVTNTSASMHPSFNSLIWRFSPFGCDPSSKNPAGTWGTIL